MKSYRGTIRSADRQVGFGLIERPKTCRPGGRRSYWRLGRHVVLSLILTAFMVCLAAASFAATAEGVSSSFALDFTLGNGMPEGPGEAVSGAFALDLRGITGPSDVLRSAVSGLFAVNLLGYTGGLSLGGTVYDAASGQVLAGAAVQLAGHNTTSDSQGKYRLSALSVGEFILTAGKDGYQTETIGVYVPPGASALRDIRLTSSLAGIGQAPRITSLACKYPGFLYFLNGSTYLLSFTANIDWANHPAGQVEFITPKGAVQVNASGTTASKVFNMGTDFGPMGKLEAVAVSSDGTRSAAKTADFIVAPAPDWMPSFGVEGNAHDFMYNAAVNLALFDQMVDSGLIPTDIPCLGGKGLNLSFLPNVKVEISSAGRGKLSLKWDNMEMGKLAETEWGKNHNLERLGSLVEDLIDKGAVDKRHLPRAGFGGFELRLFPLLGAEMQFNATTGEWEYYDAFGGLAGKVGLKYSQPFAAGPVPMYVKGAFELSADATLQAVSLFPWQPKGGELTVNPYLRGSLGAGFDELLALEGWIGGGLTMKLAWPQEQNYQTTWKECYLYVNAGATIYALLWTWDWSTKPYHWDLYEGAKSSLHASSLELAPEPKPAGRAYVQAADYGAFMGVRRSGVSASAITARPLKATTAALQLQVFPHSESQCASSGTNFGLVWLYDEPQRTAPNRTMAVFSQYDGASWTQPVPLADDGTANFHPQLLLFPDGSAVAAWEKERKPLLESATFEDMKANLEITTAWYDPGSRQWLPALTMTTNAFMDRSPKLAGKTKDQVLLVWVTNPNNDTSGSSTNANQLWFSRWNGAAWSAAQSITNLALPLLKYDLAYDGTNGHLILCLDTDGDLKTIGDHELFHLAFQNDRWSALEQLTTDAVVDDNPQLNLDPKGRLVLTWLRTNEISSVVDFDFNRRQTIRHDDDYSSNLADFQVGANPDGRLALVWAEPSQFSSDLWAVFYDPVFGLWGRPKQLTADAETERGATVAFLGKELLVAVYDRTKIILTNQTVTLAFNRQLQAEIPTPGRTDLYVLNYRMGKDLALKSGGFEVTPANPMPGQTASLNVTLMNLGDEPAAEVPVAFYQGDPAAGGQEIGRAQLTDTLVPGASTNLGFTWAVPPTTNPFALFAVVDPERVIEDADRLNNVVSDEFVKADTYVAALTWSSISSNSIAITARIGNQGAIVSSPTTVEFYQGTNTLLSRQNVGALQPGQSMDFECVLPISDLAAGEIRVVVDSAQSLNDFDRDNNLARWQFQPAATPFDLRLGQPLPLGGGVFQIQVTGQKDRAWEVWVSTDLKNWDALTNFVSTNDVMLIIDPAGTNLDRRFYRAVMP